MNLPRTRLFWAVGLGHLVNDIFMSMGVVLLAFLSVTVLPMSNTQIGLTVSATQLIGGITQPGFGLVADRTGGRWLGAGGVGWTVGFLMLALVFAQTGNFWLMFIPFALRAFGSGAFHPVGAMHAAESDPLRSASSMSYFFLMGQMGLALGPAVVGVLLDLANPAGVTAFTSAFDSIAIEPFILTSSVAPIYFLALLVIPAVSFMVFTLPTRESHQSQRGQQQKRESVSFASLPMKAFALLGVMVALRSLAQPGSVAFIPVLFQEKGWSPAEYGTITSFFWLGSAVAGVVFGNLADYFDRRWVVAASMMLSAPTFFLLPVVDGTPALLMAVTAGALSGGSHSIIVVLAQEMIPASKGFASGAILGFIFGAGALGSLLIGTLADIIGLGTTFQIVALSIGVASLLALLLPVGGHDDSASETLEETAAPSPA